MKNLWPILIICVSFCAFSGNNLAGILRVAEAAKRVVVPDFLDDVIDDEEDEAWKEWGSKKKDKEPAIEPFPDFSKMSASQIEAEVLKRQTGPAMGFVKLRLGVSRSREEVPVIAMKWSKLVRSGSIEAKFMAVDVNTIMFTMHQGQDIEELKDFVLRQAEAYELKVGERVFRRPGDPPLQQLIEMRSRERNNAKDISQDEL
ncbi:hypothetical protein AMTRI_Chr07g30030 [Amborella trichopoda]|uniref:Mesoderm development candidate 2 n=1 Tax=Amborella trichopoda TaxID=13333 RepID=W1NIC9_AMBTC|nr:uncharacterized protein LOC18422979 [Amborella trichopoda]ERM94979.1 hypothetical protein AMTR_s00009p00222480 [Amborella trichopoda]|eukprot:XP_006827563.1 uncharacterized protein LOC18422979 [Amborella trichopoda]